MAMTMLPQRTVCLLDVDPELVEGLPASDVGLARRTLVASTRALSEGEWRPQDERWDDGPPAVGLLVLDGVLTREVRFAGRATTELLGAGDVLRPWDQDAQFEALPFVAIWQVHHPVRLAILDTRFVLAAARWPTLAAAISARHVRRARGLGFQLAISQLPRVDDRLLVVLWSLAERWGRVGPQGVRLDLRLAHRALATLIGARRPSVTTALSGLARDGLVERTDDGWLLHGDPSEILASRLGTDSGADVELSNA